MKCPHCLENFHASLQTREVIQDEDGVWEVQSAMCPSCKKATIFLGTKKTLQHDPHRQIQIWPKEINRSPLPPEITESFATEYYEACLVLPYSPKASAALSRRCLQALLREKAGITPSNLSKEIGEVLASKALPPDLAEAIDDIRNVGNFAAHPLKSTNTALVLDVEPGEAEWTLDVLEILFDFYFVQPARLKAKRDALNKKLAEADASSEGRARLMKETIANVSASSRD
jgi:hypothetical protein